MYNKPKNILVLDAFHNVCLFFSFFLMKISISLLDSISFFGNLFLATSFFLGSFSLGGG